MFEKSTVKQALEDAALDQSAVGGSALEKAGQRARLSIGGGFPPFLLEQQDDRRPMRIALVLAVVIHLVFLAAQLPRLSKPPQYVGPKKVAFVTRQVRFSPPPPKAQQQVPKKRQKRKVIPIPDPTPEDPEPIRVEDEIVFEDIDLPEGEEVFGIPDSPAGVGGAVSGAMQLGGNILPPEKIYSVRPLYTEEARQARIQGVVILQAVVDTDGRVKNIKILKGLPMGLNETAIEAVQQWEYRPARLEGEAVPVYYNITISFHLQ